MAANLRGNAAGTGATVVVPSSVQAGDYALLTVITSSGTATLTTPAGWSVLAGPDNPNTFNTAWLLGRTLDGSEAGSTISLTLAGRPIVQLAVYSGVTATGLAVAKVLQSAQTLTPATPQVSSVPAGALVHVSWARRFNGTPAADVTPPSPFVQGAAERSATSFGNSPELSAESAYLVASAAGSYGGTNAAATSQSLGVSYAVVLPSASGGGTPTPLVLAGVAALASVDANAGTGLFTGAAVVVAGVPAQVQVAAVGGNITGGAVPIVTAPVQWPPDPYRQALRSGLAIWYSVDVTRGGLAVVSDLRPTGGSITDTTRPGVRRVLSLELANDPGLYDKLIPFDTELKVTAHVRYTDRQTFSLPMGVFDVDAQSLSESAGSLTVTAPDKWVRVQRARFVRPKSSQKGALVTAEIARLIRDGLGASEFVLNKSASTAKVSALTWERDRDQAIIKLATDAGLWVYADRDGVFTIEDAPTIGAAADWLVDAGSAGVLTDLDRSRSREGVANLVVVESSATERAKFPTVYVWDNDPDSPTYAGSGGGAGLSPPSVTASGPFRVVPFFYPTPNLDSVDEAIKAGKSILARVTGLASSVSLSQVPNPALDSGDVIDVLPPGQRAIGLETHSTGSSAFGTGPFGTTPFGGGAAGSALYQRVIYQPTRSIERHLCDTVTHSLTVGGEQRIEGRSTRTDEFTEGS